MDHTHPILRKNSRYPFKSVLHALEFQFGIVGDKRIHDIRLPSGGKFPAEKTVHLPTVLVEAEQGRHRFTAGRQFIYHGDIEVTVDGHGKCARDRSGCHHEYMRCNRTLLPHPGALRDAETVLLVNNGHAEPPELHRILYQRMRTYNDLYVTVLEALVDDSALSHTGASREQLDPQPEGGGPLADCLVMLRGENLRRCHHRRLAAVVGSHKHRHESHKSLPRPYIALEKAVHLPSGPHVLTDLTQHPLLRTGERKRKNFIIEPVELLPYPREHLAPDTAPPLA